MTSARARLPILDARAASRAERTHEAHPDFPCRVGCDGCCRSLPHLPSISDAEWVRLRDAILALDPVDRDDILAGIASPTASAKVVCPVLDRPRGACRAYEARPLACRTYGFFAERDGALACDLVVGFADAHEVVWGHGEAFLDDLRALGPSRTLAEHLADDRRSGQLLE